MNMDATTTPVFAPKTLLAKFPSASKPGTFHEVRVGADGVVYCGCPSWRFQKNHPSCRCCKHTKAVMDRMSHGGRSMTAQAVSPDSGAIRAPRRSKKPARTAWERL